MVKKPNLKSEILWDLRIFYRNVQQFMIGWEGEKRVDRIGAFELNGEDVLL